MKIRDDDLAGLNELEDQFMDDDWPEEPGHLEDAQQAEPDGSDEDLPDADAAADSDAFGWREESSEEESPDASEAAAEEAVPWTQKLKDRPATIKLLKVGAVCALLLSILGLATAFWHSPWHHSQPKVQEIRHPIPQQRYKQQFDFFILANSAQGRNLVKLGLVFEFRALNAYQQFQQADLVEKDLTFRFLQRVHPSSNTEDSWQPIIDKHLLAYFRSQQPHNGIVSIHIDYLDTL